MKKSLVLENEYAHLVNALPYIDEEPDPKFKDKLNSMIKEEMRGMPKRDYLERLQIPQTPYIDSEFMQKEMQRVQNGERLDAID